ncbi:MAG: peptide-methionine (S)-S-oxide reductase MsrA [Opitutaceae bacterium]|nr:peptide-methionine (S)-S-oxide reductase MsrA [Opitutaceae bacterium]MBP9912822.1 peptide-methionine (S)-S-oxide reductase MsrA [Opitutaceae bacterium]
MKIRFLFLLSLLGIIVAGCQRNSTNHTTVMATPVSENTESLVLGGGCFWCTEASYKLLPGVVHVTSGYAGGTTANPTYEEVCSETTGHAEVIKIDYDPAQTSLAKVLNYFWDIHNPTTLNRQGGDQGTSYRSIILYANEAQKVAAEQSMAEAQQTFRDPIVTQIVPLNKFWRAEEYHQDYYAKNPQAGYCQFVIAPKVKKLEHKLQAQGK